MSLCRLGLREDFERPPTLMDALTLDRLHRHARVEEHVRLAPLLRRIEPPRRVGSHRPQPYPVIPAFHEERLACTGVADDHVRYRTGRPSAGTGPADDYMRPFVPAYGSDDERVRGRLDAPRLERLRRAIGTVGALFDLYPYLGQCSRPSTKSNCHTRRPSTSTSQGED